MLVRRRSADIVIWKNPRGNLRNRPHAKSGIVWAISVHGDSMVASGVAAVLWLMVLIGVVMVLVALGNRY